MKVVNKLLNTSLDISTYINISNSIFFDIETTGLNSNKDYIYLIGCIYYQNGWTLNQFFSTNGIDEEKQIIIKFFELLKTRDILISFNGDNFDINFIKNRAKLLNLDICFNITSIDLYRTIKKYKTIFNLENYRLKTIEQFLGIYRKDIFTGEQLIKYYQQYIKNKSLDLEKNILLHNEEDLYGLLKTTEIFKYINYINDIKNIDYQIKAYNLDLIKNKLSFYIIPQIKFDFDININYKSWLCKFNKASNTISFEIDLYFGLYYHFFKDYKQYYYIPKFDEAIHKSIAANMNKKDLIRANKNNCYTKKKGYFIQYFDKSNYTVFVDLNNKKEIYIAVLIENNKYIEQNNLKDLVTAFFNII